MTVFLVDTAPRASSSVGDSVEAMNGATWLVGSRSIDTHGLIESRFGATSPELGTYAHHPPGIIAAAWIGRHLPAQSPYVLRLPATLASLLSIALLWRLLRAGGSSISGASAGLAFSVGTPMFLQFGSMLNMEAVSLPFVIGLLICWRDKTNVRPQVLGALAAAAALTSWQGVLFVLLIGGTESFEIVRSRRLRSDQVGLGLGGLIGIGLTVGWLWWANGNFEAVFSSADRRRDTGTITLGAQVARQVDLSKETFPVWILVLGLPGLVIAALAPRFRAVILISIAVTVAFIVAFPEGAYRHLYWNWWLILPWAIAGAALADATARGLFGRVRWKRLVHGLIATAAVASIVVVATGTPKQERTFWAGIEAGRLLETAVYPTDQSVAYVYYGDEWATWVSWHTHRPFANLWTAQEMTELAQTEPDHLVLMRRTYPFVSDDSWAPVRESAAQRVGDYYALLRMDDAAKVVAQLDGSAN